MLSTLSFLAALLLAHCVQCANISSAASAACGTGEVSAQFLELTKSLRASSLSSFSRRQLPQTFSFKLHAHVVYSGSACSAAEGFITKNDIEAERLLLNRHFEGSGISFTKGTITYNQDKWRNDREEMKRALHRGGYADLNIYYVPAPKWQKTADGRLVRNQGNCRHPVFFYVIFDGGRKILDYTTVMNQNIWIPSEENRKVSGCDVNAERLHPSDTVHEVGHWLGLQHTFDTGCAGDPVLGIHPQMKITWRCEQSKQKIQQTGKVDDCGASQSNMYNIMDYS
ncbi:hypothetical protein ED733_007294 [Metarhizium rileyi]|uniref:Peptidase M43 pregnancy-associated plasma-A domain-containing protein n=1 Tax=Metarhizium rileyi (strain RCEF 4871) TaxID=1649241 RepID=A0A5C6GP93_METRR|nr:hypothetical protein ED733_007294 [Metarhizium rileyi]